MSFIIKAIANADAEARFLSPGELDQIKSFVTSSGSRLNLIKILTENRDRIVKQSGNQLFQKRPDVVSPGGNAYGQEMTATCLRDLDYYLRLITYSVIAGDSTPIQEIGIIGVKEMYRSLGTPLEGVADGVRAMKNVVGSIISVEDARIVNGYFDFLIAGLQ